MNSKKEHIDMFCSCLKLLQMEIVFLEFKKWWVPNFRDMDTVETLRACNIASLIRIVGCAFLLPSSKIHYS